MTQTPAFLAGIPQTWPAPSQPRPVVIIGAGGIVRAAHLPAYRAAHLPVLGLFDVDAERGRALARDFDVKHAFASLEEAISADADAVFDLALPPHAHREVLSALPPGSSALIQKPFGIDLAAASELLDLCRASRLTAAVNFQLRFAPNMLVVRELIRSGRLGRVTDVDVHVCVDTPWANWPFLRGLPRMEIALHSIHYLDLIRSLFGTPRDVLARTFRDPDSPDLHSTRTSAILSFDDDLRCSITTHHAHRFGRRFQTSHLRVEGTRGALVAQMGVNLNYPVGEPDTLSVAIDDEPWIDVPLRGSWFPDAFAGPMFNLQRFIGGADAVLETAVEDGWRTMALVEACYDSSELGGVNVASR